MKLLANMTKPSYAEDKANSPKQSIRNGICLDALLKKAVAQPKYDEES